MTKQEFIVVATIAAIILVPGFLAGWLFAPWIGFVVSLVIGWLFAFVVGWAQPPREVIAVVKPAVYKSDAVECPCSSCARWRQKVLNGGNLYNNGSPEPSPEHRQRTISRIEGRL